MEKSDQIFILERLCKCSAKCGFKRGRHKGKGPEEPVVVVVSGFEDVGRIALMKCREWGEFRGR
jgi:hypothetical protein